MLKSILTDLIMKALIISLLIIIINFVWISANLIYLMKRKVILIMFKILIIKRVFRNILTLDKILYTSYRQAIQYIQHMHRINVMLSLVR
ncbi:hypothetical protein B0P06_002252 [Clostridium saccharoperbutylacetonicum]|jgi:hypothetical protein|uniref:Uncharacterized protein n=1 Tax=Clostridium saccharoperbutylacetonicum N1-4(HMT) TaxID=931276 RepID=M1MY02_9CLOT|nr:hypothetical protein Cspa_c56860 [Clostridium saccharoperbutylacetonicum N1-4(HMT)]AQR98076.1 hypothetical protein CLSAP_54270 [Clostridium saccharoperbutylacetonicum]NRT59798.1 hypothetical protein [Clostridium saccharoperbutylacetonicum]NSB23110.1 hypothetical protein [Clostridium saccharoperbutylacetonicum]NSB33969.1 hypothetical protein [Clostridium saccharoperbutylacetonicum]